MDAAHAIEPETLAEFLKREKVTCREILNMMAAIDDGIVEAKPEEMKELAKLLRDKTDSYYHVLEDIKAERAKIQMRIDMRVKMLQAEAKAIDRDEKNLMQLLLWNMESNGLTEMHGDEYLAKIKESRGSLVALDEPKPVDKVKYPGLIRTVYEWDKNAVKRYITEKTKDQIKNEVVGEEFLIFSKRFKIEKSKKVEFKPNTKRNRK